MLSIAAGENDYEVDRVAFFEASCQAFSPILFDLRQESGFEEFEAACKKTAESLHKDPKMIEKLVMLILMMLMIAQSYLLFSLICKHLIFMF